jgi:Flp pilus assembly protein TadG
MLSKKSEKGQAIIMIVFSIIGLVALTGLTVDGGRAFSDRRAAQGAADSAAWAAGLANARNSAANETTAQIAARIAKVQEAGLNIADKNKYGSIYGSNVTVNVVSLPVAPAPLPDGSANPCPNGVSPNVEITVSIRSQVNMFFAPVIGLKQMTNNVQAVSRACGTYVDAIFGGNAIVSCGNGIPANADLPNGCAYNGGNSNTTTWTIHGGGGFSGTCTFSSGAVTLDPGECFSTVNSTYAGNLNPKCAGTAASLCTPSYLDSLMPLNPCDYTDENDPALIAAGIELIDSELIHLTQAQLAAMPSPKTFTDAIYCINDLGNNSGTDPLSGEEIVLNNATLYITDLDFEMKFAGGGGFSGSPTVAGTYARYAIIVARDDADPCLASTGALASNDDQVMEYRGNSFGTLYGTILAPTACIDMRGNSGSTPDPLTINSQIIANSLSSNGNATITVVYDDTQNRQEPISPTIILVK